MRIRLLCRRLLLIILGPLLVLGGLEGVLRLRDYGFPTGFLVPRDINGRRVVVDNQFFGYRFFPPRMSRTPAPIVIEPHKPPGVVRVFVLGESAAMGEPLSEFGLPRMMQYVLDSHYPGTRFEVVNAAMTAINSHVIVEISQDLAKYEPDYFVMYMGNNEVVGPFGPGTIFDSFSRVPGITRARVVATRLRLAQFIRNVLAHFSRVDRSRNRWEGMGMFTERRVVSGDPRLDRVHEEFGRNLDKIIETARRSGAQVVLSTVAVNLRDCPPFAADGDDYEQGVAAEKAGDIKGALAHFERARDRDRLRFRADSEINRIIRDTAQRYAGDVTLVDAERLFADASTNGLTGAPWFVDHVHFSFEGNHLLAVTLAKAMLENDGLVSGSAGSWPTAQACKEHLLYTRWNQIDLVEMLIARRRNPPFRDQPGNVDQIASLIQRKLDLGREIEIEDLDALRSRYEDAMKKSPGDWYYPAEWAEVLLNCDRYQEAEMYLRKELELLPHRFDVRGGLALDLGYMSRVTEGVSVVTKPETEKTGDFPLEMLLNTARTLVQGGWLEEARVYTEAAASLSPRNVDAALELGARYATLGRTTDAERMFRKVLSWDPNNVAALDELAALLTLTHRWDEADSLLKKVMQKDPSNTEPRMKYVQFLIFRGAHSDAATELQGVLQDHSDNAQAWFLLGRLQGLQGDWDAAATACETSLSHQEDARTHYELAHIDLKRGHALDAVREFQKAISLEPDRAEFQTSLAWTLATHPDPAVLNGSNAVAIAEEACLLTHRRDARALDVLAAALAAAKEFGAAVEMAGRAQALAKNAGREDYAGSIEERRHLYEQGLPYVDKFEKN